MGRLINTASMTIDGAIDVSDWFVAQGDHDGAPRAIFESERAAMLVGRKSFEGFAGFWPTQSGAWADVLNPLPKYVASRSTLEPLERNATAIEGDAVEGVRLLKAEHPGDLVHPVMDIPLHIHSSTKTGLTEDLGTSVLDHPGPHPLNTWPLVRNSRMTLSIPSKCSR